MQTRCLILFASLVSVLLHLLFGLMNTMILPAVQQATNTKIHRMNIRKNVSRDSTFADDVFGAGDTTLSSVDGC